MVCKICDEKDKKTRAYVNCAKAGGIVCMEHCSECEHYRFVIGISRCEYPVSKKSKIKEDLLQE